MDNDAQVTAPEDIEGSAPSQDATDANASSSAPADRQELLDRLTAMGRERKAEQERVRYLEGQLGYTGQALQNQGQQLQSIQSQMSQQKWQEFENRLATMNPVDAANERARVSMEYSKSLEQRLTAAQQRPVAPPQQQRQETDDEYSIRRANEKLALINEEFELTGRDALTIKDMPSVAWKNEEKFTLEAGKMAQKRTTERKSAEPTDDAKVKDMVAKEVARITGASRGMSPSPHVQENGPESEEVAKIAAQHTTNRRGPAASIAELRKYREQIAAKVGQ